VAENDWDPVFAPEMVRLLGDPYIGVQTTAQLSLRAQQRFPSMVPTLKKLISEDAPGAPGAIFILEQEPFSRSEVLRMLSSTNLAVLKFAISQLSRTESVDELKPILTNSLPTARYLGLEELARMRNKPAIDRIVAMLRDPNEGIRWTARADFRVITKQMLGADPAKYEQWWVENRESFTPAP
jgi:HEAT repeat protein